MLGQGQKQTQSSSRSNQAVGRVGYKHTETLAVPTRPDLAFSLEKAQAKIHV